MRNILVIGGMGFVGSSFINIYKSINAHDFIVNLDELDYYNITNKENILCILEQYSINIVIHFSTQFTFPLLEACKEYNKLQKFIHISTNTFSENIIPIDLNTEFLVNLPTIIIRKNDVYGPRQCVKNLIPQFITNLLNNQKCQIKGDGSDRRNFIYIDDFIDSIIYIIEKGIVNQIYDIKTNNEYSINDIVNILIKKIKPNDSFNDWVEYVKDDYHKLDWVEKINFYDGITSTIEWYDRKWLIFGNNSWIEKQIVNILIQRNEYVIPNHNIRVDEEMEEIIKQTQPTRIIYLSNITDLTNNLEQNIRDKLYLPFILAELCKKYHIHFIYLETESCDINDSSYSIINRFTDRIMKFYEEDILYINIRMPITDELFCDHNFIYKFTHNEKIYSTLNSMSVLPELLPIMIDMSINKKTGIINLTNSGKISHNEILQMYKEIVDPNFRWINLNREEQNNEQLNDNSLLQWYPNVKNIHTSIKDVLYSMKRQKDQIDSRYKEFKFVIDSLYNKYVIMKTQNILCVENNFFIGNNIYNYSLKEIQKHTINTLFIKSKVLNIGLIHLRNVFDNELFLIIKNSEILINISRPIITFVDNLDNRLVFNFLHKLYYNIYYINDNNINKQFITIPNEKDVNLSLEYLVKLQFP